jgi:hypothetical protein
MISRQFLQEIGVTWCVEVTGDHGAMNMLAESMAGSSTTITLEEGKFILQSDAFDDHDTAQDVAGKAKDILSTLSGAVRLKLGGHTSMAIGSAYRVRDSGGRDYFIMPEPAQIKLRVFPATLVVTKSDGTQEIDRPADQVGRLAKLAANDDRVAKALRLRDHDDLGWVELYRIYEVVDSDIGRSKIVANGWASAPEINLFKHTANSVTAVGDQARHGKETEKPPANPMTLTRAKKLIDAVLNGWLANKVSTI